MDVDELEAIDFDDQIEVFNEEWNKEGEIVFDEDDLSEDWEEVNMGLPQIVFVNEENVVMNVDIFENESSAEQNKNPRKKRAPLEKKFQCPKCNKKYAIEIHFTKHLDICTKKKLETTNDQGKNLNFPYAKIKTI